MTEDEMNDAAAEMDRLRGGTAIGGFLGTFTDRPKTAAEECSAYGLQLLDLARASFVQARELHNADEAGDDAAGLRASAAIERIEKQFHDLYEKRNAIAQKFSLRTVPIELGDGRINGNH